jgi:hypothetical protein
MMVVCSRLTRAGVRYPWRWMFHSSLVRWQSRRAWCRSSMVSNHRTQSRVLLERAGEALGAAVSLGGADTGGRTRRAEEPDLLLEVAAHVLGAMVVADLQTCGDVAADRAEAVAHRLADRLEGVEAGGAVAGVDPDALDRAVIDRDEDGG